MPDSQTTWLSCCACQPVAPLHASRAWSTRVKCCATVHITGPDAHQHAPQQARGARGHQRFVHIWTCADDPRPCTTHRSTHDVAGLIIFSAARSSAGLKTWTAWRSQIMNHHLGPTLWSRTVRDQSVGPKFQAGFRNQMMVHVPRPIVKLCTLWNIAAHLMLDSTH